MHEQLYRQVFAVQGRHWWGRNRRKLSVDLLKHFGLVEGCRHLDIGCGTGQNLGLLDALHPSRVVGIDVSPVALELAGKARPGAELVSHDINRPLPFPDRSFDAATIFNVLYHQWIADDAAVLREAARVLAPDGLLLVTEPAFSALARDHDIAGMTKRRYRLRPMVEAIRSAGLDVLRANYFTSFGAPIILGMNLVNKIRRSRGPAAGDESPDMQLNPVTDAIFYGLARAEAPLIKAAVPIPFGTTLICLARRP
jgi:SAM-dependent methyltransferase